MKKQLMIVGIIIILLIVGLSGCNEQSNNENTNNKYSNYVQLSNITIITFWNFASTNIPSGSHDGIYHNYPSDCYSVFFIISGTVTNIADKPIDLVELVVKFYDDNNNYIASTFGTSVTGLYLGESGSFQARLSKVAYFDHISDYKVEVTNVVFHQ
ncbi:MAG: FxLYD domain-containing protein [Candidatus Thermoplasmatota archaeon]|nr:FxLYD domain-containing protein [Candidatus Thermoplasmatota archaeon]